MKQYPQSIYLVKRQNHNQLMDNHGFENYDQCLHLATNIGGIVTNLRWFSAAVGYKPAIELIPDTEERETC